MDSSMSFVVYQVSIGNFGDLHIRVIPKVADNPIYEKGIENLLNIPATFDKDRFYLEEEKIDDYCAASTIRRLDKTKLCRWIRDELSVDEQKEYCKYFNHIFEMLEL